MDNKNVFLPKTHFLQNNFGEITQIGCGGTGGFLVPQIARTLYDMKNTRGGGRNSRYILIDGDKVEEKNLLRQNFVQNDIGKYKAEVLAQRYSAAFGIAIEYKTDFLNADNVHTLSASNYTDRSMIIGCVDNHATRKLIYNLIIEAYKEYYDEEAKYKPVYIDSGNELTSGQVFINAMFRNVNRGSASSPPYFSDMKTVYKGIFESNDKHPDDLSCAERVISGEQSLSINATAANVVFNIVNAFLNLEKIFYYNVTFGSNNTVSRNFIDSYIEDVLSKNKKRPVSRRGLKEVLE